jgi:hypothetical protein
MSQATGRLSPWCRTRQTPTATPETRRRRPWPPRRSSSLALGGAARWPLATPQELADLAAALLALAAAHCTDDDLARAEQVAADLP